MFKHILIPTDGSKLATKGVKAGMKLSRALGAKVTGLYVIFPYVPPLYNEAALYYVPGLSPEESKKAYENQAKRALQLLQKEAKASAVRCQTRFAPSGHPWQAILRIARSAKCDAVVMGGAILVGLFAFALARKRARSFLGGAMNLPEARELDARLVGGSIVFGIGWGLAGFCPGPAIVSLGAGYDQAAAFVAAMLVGMVLYTAISGGLFRPARTGQR